MSRGQWEGRAKALVVAVSLALLIGLAVGLFLLLFERTEREFFREPSAEVRSNPLAAARLFLEEMGAEVTEQRGVGTLPTPEGTLLVMMPEEVGLTDEEWASLAEWAKWGGSLIIGPEPQVLDVFGLEVEPWNGYGIPVVYSPEDGPPPEPEAEEEEPGDDPAAGDEGAGEAAEEEDGDELVEVELPWVAEPFRVVMYPASRLAAAEGGEFPSGGHLYVAEEEDGGRIVLVRDMEAFDNYLIGEEDNAALLLALVADRIDEPVVLARASIRPTLMAKLLRRGWPFWVSALVLLAAWVWSRSRRFGPLAADPEPGRRSLAEHLAASGEFLWRGGHHAGLLSAARDAVLTRAAASHPGWENLPWGRRCERLARGTGLEAREVAEALHSPSPRAEDFVRHMWILEKVRLKQAR